jgi:hypothetical protein
MRVAAPRGRDAVRDEEQRAVPRPAGRWPPGSRPRSSRRRRRAGRRARAPAARARARARGRRAGAAPGELHAALADDRVEAVGQPLDLVEHRGLARGRARTRPSPRGCPDRRARSRCCAPRWSRTGTRPAARSRCSRAPSRAADRRCPAPSRNTAPGGVGKSRGEQHGDGALARAGATHDRERAARGHLEAHVVDDVARSPYANAEGTRRRRAPRRARAARRSRCRARRRRWREAAA